MSGEFANKPGWLNPVSWIARLVFDYCLWRRADENIYRQDGVLYLRRWHLVRNRWGNVYIHQMIENDDRTVHDHPWWSLSLVLGGTYRDWRLVPCRGPAKRPGDIYLPYRPAGGSTAWGAAGWLLGRLYGPGAVILRRPEYAHRLELAHGAQRHSVWTLFMTGPKCREWGFYAAKGWMHWKAYLYNQPSRRVRVAIQGENWTRAGRIVGAARNPEKAIAAAEAQGYRVMEEEAGWVVRKRVDGDWVVAVYPD